MRFRWAREPTSSELTQLTHTIARRTARFLERQGLLERDAEQAYFTAEAVDGDPMESLLGPAITYRIAIGPHQGRKVMTLQTLPPDEPYEPGAGQVGGFSLPQGTFSPRSGAHLVHAGVAAKAGQRDKPDTGHTSDMETLVRRYYQAQLAIVNMGDINTMGPEEAAWAVNELIRPKAAIPTHANEQSTSGGKPVPGGKLAQFLKLVNKDIDVHLPLSGKRLQFDRNARCVEGC